MSEFVADADLSIDALHDSRLKPGEYPIVVTEKVTIDLEMVSGGGGGGGASDTHDDWASTGCGGMAGGYLFKRYDLKPGRYLLTVGKGGAAGKSGPAGTHATGGEDGGHSGLSHFSGLPVDTIKGGKGGAADDHDGGSESKGGDGENLTNPQTGVVIGTGGKGGIWGFDGEPAAGFGAGGGGCGGSRLPTNHGGNGGDGFARLTKVS